MPLPTSKQPATCLASTRPVEMLIHLIGGQRVILDADLAALYDVSTGGLNQAVRRNLGRFPADFMFRLTSAESENLKSQSVTSSWGGRRRSLPHAFTQEGVAMLSAVLRSSRAIQTSIAIMRTFIRLREIMAHHKDIAARIEDLERGHDRTASVIDRLAGEVKQMKLIPPSPRRRIGFRIGASGEVPTIGP
jgi:hypothetical protein